MNHRHKWREWERDRIVRCDECPAVAQMTAERGFKIIGCAEKGCTAPLVTVIPKPLCAVHRRAHDETVR